MTKQIVRTDQAPAPVGPYNQAIISTGKLLFAAGQIPLDPLSGEIIGTGDVTKQTEQVMHNLTAVLKAGGTGWQEVVKTTVFLKNMEDFPAMNAVYALYFTEGQAPARATVEVARLPKDVLVEIECIAAVP